MTPREILQALAAPLAADAVSWRVGSTNKRNFDKKEAQTRRGLPLAYIDARDVMERLDAVMGIDWQCEYIAMPNGSCCCRIGLFIDGQWRWRSNGAVNLSEEGDRAEAREMAEKGSYSDAFKRAAVLWGIGQYLYRVKAQWIELDDFWGIPAASMQKLQALLRRGGAPAAAQTPAPPAPAKAAQPAPAPLASDPKIAALNRPKPQSAPRGPSVRDSASVRRLILLSLEACKTRDHMLDVWAEGGKQSDKWSLMLAADQDAVLVAFADKSAALKAIEAGADPETGEIAA